MLGPRSTIQIWHARIRPPAMVTALLLTITLTSVGSRSYAQDLGYIFVESPTLHPTIVKVPDDFDRNRTYSVIVGLHGFGATPESFLGTTFDIANAGFILASVTAPYRFLLNDTLTAYDWSYRYLRQAALSRRATQLSIDYILAAVAGLRTSYPIDKVYLMGFSQGGAFAYLTTAAHPEIVDGLIALGSRFDATWFQERGRAATGFPVLILHGERESERSVAGAMAARDYLQGAGYDVTFRTFDVGHAVPPEMVATVIEWLQAR